jgi:hypothetical protein
VKDDCAAVAAIQDMIGVASELTARNPRHEAGRYENWRGEDKGKVACPSFSPSVNESA